MVCRSLCKSHLKQAGSRFEQLVTNTSFLVVLFVDMISEIIEIQLKDAEKVFDLYSEVDHWRRIVQVGPSRQVAVGDISCGSYTTEAVLTNFLKNDASLILKDLIDTALYPEFLLQRTEVAILARVSGFE